MRSSFTPSKHQYFVLRVFEVTSSYTERREVETRMITGNRTWDLTHRRPRTNQLRHPCSCQKIKSNLFRFSLPGLPLRRLPHIQAKLSAMMITLCRPEGWHLVSQILQDINYQGFRPSVSDRQAFKNFLFRQSLVSKQYFCQMFLKWFWLIVSILVLTLFVRSRINFPYISLRLRTLSSTDYWNHLLASVMFPKLKQTTRPVFK